jgi:hypothetical protein
MHDELDWIGSIIDRGFRLVYREIHHTDTLHSGTALNSFTYVFTS